MSLLVSAWHSLLHIQLGLLNYGLSNKLSKQLFSKSSALQIAMHLHKSLPSSGLLFGGCVAAFVVCQLAFASCTCQCKPKTATLLQSINQNKKVKARVAQSQAQILFCNSCLSVFLLFAYHGFCLLLRAFLGAKNRSSFDLYLEVPIVLLFSKQTSDWLSALPAFLLACFVAMVAVFTAVVAVIIIIVVVFVEIAEGKLTMKNADSLCLPVLQLYFSLWL